MSEELRKMEECATALFEAEKAYKAAANKLRMWYSAGHGSDEDREHACDHLEDAELVPRRKFERFDNEEGLNHVLCTE